MKISDNRKAVTGANLDSVPLGSVFQFDNDPRFFLKGKDPTNLSGFVIDLYTGLVYPDGTFTTVRVVPVDGVVVTIG